MTAHGGRLEIHSTPGEGTVASAVFPRSRIAPAPATSDEADAPS